MLRWISILLVLLFSQTGFAGLDFKYQMCLDDCLAYSQPGYELKSCVLKCQKEYAFDATYKFLWCETYEDDCERPSEDTGPDGTYDGDDREGSDHDGGGYNGI